jgi:hypothetical protein
MSRIAKLIAAKSKTLRASEVLSYLGENGFAVEPTVIWVKGYGYGLVKDGINGGVLFASLEAATASFNTVQAEIAKGLPTPAVGDKAIIKAKKPKTWTDTLNPWMMDDLKAKHGTETFYTFDFDSAEAVAAKAITSPEGKTFNFYSDDAKTGLTALLKWLHAETTVGQVATETVQKAETAKVEAVAAEKAAKNIKTCPCCFGEYVAKPGMVHHGYTRPGDGTIYGDCFGVSYLPYEESCEGTIALSDALQNRLPAMKSYLAKLQAGEVTELTIQKQDMAAWNKYGARRYTSEVITAEDKRFAETLRAQTSKKAAEIQQVERDLAFLTNKINTWVKKG